MLQQAAEGEHGLTLVLNGTAELTKSISYLKPAEEKAFVQKAIRITTDLVVVIKRGTETVCKRIV